MTDQVRIITTKTPFWLFAAKTSEVNRVAFSAQIDEVSINKSFIEKPQNSVYVTRIVGYGPAAWVRGPGHLVVSLLSVSETSFFDGFVFFLKQAIRVACNGRLPDRNPMSVRSIRQENVIGMRCEMSVSMVLPRAETTELSGIAFQTRAQPKSLACVQIRRTLLQKSRNYLTRRG